MGHNKSYQQQQRQQQEMTQHFDGLQSSDPENQTTDNAAGNNNAVDGNSGNTDPPQPGNKLLKFENRNLIIILVVMALIVLATLTISVIAIVRYNRLQDQTDSTTQKLQTDLGALKDDNTALKNKNDELEIALKVLQNNRNINDNNGDNNLTAVLTRLTNLEVDVGTADQKCETIGEKFSTEIKKLEIGLEQVHTTVADHLVALDKVSGEVTQVQDDIKSLDSKVEQTSTTLEEQKDGVKLVTNKAEELERNLKKANEKTTALEDELKLVNNKAEDLEGNLKTTNEKAATQEAHLNNRQTPNGQPLVTNTTLASALQDFQLHASCYGDGQSSSSAGCSCTTILRTHNDSKDGTYWANAYGTKQPFKIFCDMTTDGGGWALVVRKNTLAESTNLHTIGAYAPDVLLLDTSNMAGKYHDHVSNALGKVFRVRSADSKYALYWRGYSLQMHTKPSVFNILEDVNCGFPIEAKTNWSAPWAAGRYSPYSPNGYNHCYADSSEVPSFVCTATPGAPGFWFNGYKSWTGVSTGGTVWVRDE